MERYPRRELDELVREAARSGIRLPPPPNLPAGLGSHSWRHDDASSLWVPVPVLTPLRHEDGSRAGEVEGMRAQTYMTASEILGHAVAVEDVAAQLQQAKAANVITHVARILAELDVHTQSSEQVDERWLPQLLEGDALQRARGVFDRGARFLAPQLLLSVTKLALLLGSPGPPDDPPTEGVAQATLAMLSLADVLGARAGEQEPLWGGWPASLALEMVSNQHFNAAEPLQALVGRFQRAWVELGAHAAVRRRISSPTDLYRDATGSDWADAAAVVLAIHAQAALHRFVRFPPKFFAQLGLAPMAVEKVLATMCATQDALADLVRDEVTDFGLNWSFNALRRFPLVRLADDSIVVTSLQFLIERTFHGGAVYWQIVNHLRERDDSRTEQRFTNVHADILEAYATEAARTIAPALPGSPRVYSESEMQAAWRSRKSGAPSVCDIVIDYGDAWLCLEVIASRLSEAAVNGSDIDALNRDLDKFVTKRKAQQLASTIRLLNHRESDLTGRPPSKQRRFIPVLVAAYGFPVNSATMREVRNRLSDARLLQPPIVPLGIVSIAELEMIESLTESSGIGAARLILDWAEGSGRDAPLNNYLAGQGLRLAIPNRTRLLFKEVMNGVVARMQAGLS